MRNFTIAGVLAVLAGIIFLLVPEHRVMNFYTEITTESAAVLGQTLNNLETGDRLDINISSPGGNFILTAELLYRLTESPATINAHVRSLAASGAALIMCGADNIYIKKNSIVLFHTIRLQNPDGSFTIVTEKNAKDPVTKSLLKVLNDNLDLCVKKGLLNEDQLRRVKAGEDVIISIPEDLKIETK